ncbi:uncharacterized protein LOC132933339 [Metopolophium dirhodum]|uniref:uncharacterized protein LOC132933339 n=1 Tax=Metopolophium dirhodum TaxID=44670 RepID=UPI0029904E26|nr:uncharacterized protein LOC132933339 [Metopolophium dirhodum]
MAGRKCVIEPSLVIDAVIFYKESVIITNENNEKKVAVATDRVWSDISSKLDNRMSASAIHTFVYKGRNGIKERLGFLPLKTFPVSTNIIDENQLSNGSGT